MSQGTLSPSTASIAQSNLKFTERAADKVAALITEEKNPNLKLRILINGGGCSGFQYSFAFEETVHEEDLIFEQPTSTGTKVNFIVDMFSFQYLNNAEIDYTKGIQGEQFVIKNPNAKTTCGCGSSFSIDDE